MSEPKTYLLIKRGLYYRPDNAGYTGLKKEAGRYLETDARPDAGVAAIHEDLADEFAPACWQEAKLAERDREIFALKSELAARNAAPNIVRLLATALYDEKIASLDVKSERFSFDRAPVQEQLDYEAKARELLGDLEGNADRAISLIAKSPAIQQALSVGFTAREQAMCEDLNDFIGAFNTGALAFFLKFMTNLPSPETARAAA
ncbi:hypothetical protein [Erythrobacter aureus]|uniref:Uncharacterized protein n=1 Tax=Erythrobacter aureus TaxID=2182384 RepID=A0A345YJ59_9SPHN|nr:hypothetical protein [Erythrobacter aureus]AXK43961.1 hypothetical protein DVR09_16025 [Erythrobacter aureus]